MKRRKLPQGNTTEFSVPYGVSSFPVNVSELFDFLETSSSSSLPKDVTYCKETLLNLIMSYLTSLTSYIADFAKRRYQMRALSCT